METHFVTSRSTTYRLGMRIFGFASRSTLILNPGLAHVAATKQIAHINDLRAEPPYLEGNPAVVAIVDLAGARTILIVPMLKESTLVGTISIFRQEVRLFKEKQVELVTNCADQSCYRNRERAPAERAAQSHYNSKLRPPTC